MSLSTVNQILPSVLQSQPRPRDLHLVPADWWEGDWNAELSGALNKKEEESTQVERAAKSNDGGCFQVFWRGQPRSQDPPPSFPVQRATLPLRQVTLSLLRQRLFTYGWYYLFSERVPECLRFLWCHSRCPLELGPRSLWQPTIGCKTRDTLCKILEFSWWTSHHS